MIALNLKKTTLAFSLSFAVALVISTVTCFYGNVNTFLLLNENLGNFGDFFFNYITYFGDGIVWAIVIVLTIIYKKKYWIISLGSCFFSTIIAQGIKGFILPAQLRPNSVILNKNLFHTIPNVYLNDVGSFPSGHTASVFCFFFLACLFMSNKWVLPVGFIIAILTGYSRVYQAQHFPIDVAGGIVAAIISVFISIQIQKGVMLKNKKL